MNIMMLVKESELRGLFIHPIDIEHAIKIPFSNRYVLYGNSEERYSEAVDRRASFEQVGFWGRLALARGS